MTLPFKGNRLKEGWEISLIEQTQTGNPLNFHTSNAAFTGSANLRPNVTGPVMTGFSPATNGSAPAITYIQNPSVFVNPGNAFGNLGRNAITGPGFSNLDFALVKNTKITEASQAAGAHRCVRLCSIRSTSLTRSYHRFFHYRSDHGRYALPRR